MEVITIETGAFQQLMQIQREAMEHTLESLREQLNDRQWIDEREAMELLGIKSKPTLQKYRDNDWIRYAQHGLSTRKCFIKYDRRSILDFLESKANR